jgi:hypothetical protein
MAATDSARPVDPGQPQWRSAAALDRQIQELCERRGLRFEPHELAPWEASSDGPSPWPASCAGALSWPAAQRLRRRLIAELRQAEKR